MSCGVFWDAIECLAEPHRAIVIARSFGVRRRHIAKALGLSYQRVLGMEHAAIHRVTMRWCWNTSAVKRDALWGSEEIPKYVLLRFFVNAQRLRQLPARKRPRIPWAANAMI